MRALALLVVVVAVVAGCGRGDDDAAQATARPAETVESVEVSLKAENGSGQSGTATLTPSGETFEVVLDVDGGVDGQHAHIHNVTCEKYAKIKGFDAQLATVADELEDLRGGKSTTSVAVLEGGGLTARTTGEYSINVHKPNHPYPAVACGDIPKR